MLAPTFHSHSHPVAPLILSLDIGTSSVRAMLFDAHAHVIPGTAAQIKYAARTTPAGGNEFDADTVRRDAERVIDETLARAGELANQVVAVASDSLVSNVLGVDESGNAVTPAYTYADTRCASQVDELRAQFDERATQQRVGTLFHTSYLPARLIWLARNLPQTFRFAKYWMSLGEYFYWNWTGARACSYSVAAWTGLLNRRALNWDAELIRQLPIAAEQLSPLVDHTHPVGALRAEYATRWAALRHAKFFPTLGDGAAANVGSGCVDATRIALTIGTSSAMRIAYPRGAAEIPFGLWSYSVTRELELLGGALSEGGMLYDWMNDTLRTDPATRGDAQVATLAPDAHGLTVLPFLAGERAPNWNAHARAAIVGLSLNTQPAEILRAGMESIAYRLGLIFGLLRGAIPDARQVIASGGALMKSPVWTQIIADTLGVPVIAAAEPEATSRGNALLALKALGVIGALADLPAQTGAVYEPDAARHEIYARAMERQNALYDKLVRQVNT